MSGPGPSVSVEETVSRRGDVTRLPILLLAPHSRCNCRCVMCDIWRATGRQEITPAQVGAWLPDLAGLGVERVVLTGGEALMHSDLWGLCRPIREAGIAITLLSTGLLLERDAARVAEYCDEVIVSLDGPPAIHDAIRRVRGAFDRLRSGVAALRAAHGAVVVSGRCTVQHANVAALLETVVAAASLPLDHISFLAVDVTSAAFNRPEGWPASRRAEVGVGVEDLPTLADQLARLEHACADHFTSGFIVETPDKLRRRLLWHFEALHGMRPFPPQRCNAPWVSTVVEANGTVRPCFFHPPIGNVHQAGGLRAAVCGPAGRAFRRGLDVSTDSTCQACVCTLYREGAP